MDLERAKTIGKSFGLLVHRSRPYDSLYMKRAVYRISTDKGDFAIKPFRAGRKVLSCIRLLSERKYPHMSRWLTTPSGRFLAKDKHSAYYVAEWVSGRSLSSREEDFAMLGRALARLHRIPLQIVEKRNSPTKIQYLSLRAQDLRYRSRIAQLRNRVSPEARWLAESSRIVCDWGDQAWEWLRGSETKEVCRKEIRHPAMIHGDVTVPNVVVAPDGIKLIDWDRIKIGSVYGEIAKTMANTAGFRTDAMSAFLGGYESVRPLSAAECRLITALFRYPREFWFAAREVVLGKKSVYFTNVKGSWEDRRNANEWMDDWAAAARERNIGV